MAFTYSASNLPAGLAIDSATGEISGDPTGPLSTEEFLQTLNVDVTGVDSNGLSATKTVPYHTINRGGGAKGGYDLSDPTKLKTDIVASFTDANAENFQGASTLSGRTSCTVSVWVNCSADGTAEFIVTQANAFNLLKNAANKFVAQHSSDGSGFVAIESLDSADGGWHLITVTFDGVSLSISIDAGTPVSASIAGTTPANSESLYVGRKAGSSLYYDSEMQHVAIWNRALTTAEITTLYNGGTPQPIPASLETGGVSYWPLWEPRGVRYDQWGSNHLTDNNTVGAAHGPVEIQAGEYAGITAISDQAQGAGSGVGLVLERAISGTAFAPQLVGGVLVQDPNGAAFELVTNLVQPYTLVTSVTPTGESGINDILDSSPSSSDRLTLRRSGGNVYVMVNDSKVTSDISLTLNTKYLLVLTIDGASSTLSLNGVEHTFNAGGISPTRLQWLNNYISQAGVGFQGSAEALLVFDGALTGEEEQVFSYLYS